MCVFCNRQRKERKRERLEGYWERKKGELIAARCKITRVWFTSWLIFCRFFLPLLSAGSFPSHLLIYCSPAGLLQQAAWCQPILSLPATAATTRHMKCPHHTVFHLLSREKKMDFYTSMFNMFLFHKTFVLMHAEKRFIHAERFSQLQSLVSLYFRFYVINFVPVLLRNIASRQKFRLPSLYTVKWAFRSVDKSFSLLFRLSVFQSSWFVRKETLANCLTRFCGLWLIAWYRISTTRALRCGPSLGSSAATVGIEKEPVGSRSTSRNMYVYTTQLAEPAFAIPWSSSGTRWQAGICTV